MDPTILTDIPQPEQGEISLSASAYSGNENSGIQFDILRSMNETQIVEVGWAITNASVIPVSGIVTFQSGDTIKSIIVAAQEVGPTEIGDVTITGATALSDISNVPAIVVPFTATFTIHDSPSLLLIDNFHVLIGQTHDMNQYIVDTGANRTDTIVDGLAGFMSYDSNTEIITRNSLGLESGLTMRMADAGEIL